MTTYTPPVRRVKSGRGHTYKDANGLRVPGVTTILGDGVPKPALMNWGPKVTAEYAVDHWDELGQMTPSARLSKLEKARYEDRDTAANKGTRVHALAERLAKGEEVAVEDDLAGHVESYVQFLNDWEPDAFMLEAVVMSHRHGYAGTFDVAARFEDRAIVELLADQMELPHLLELDRPVTAIGDTKTSRSGIFGETALQLAAYRFADVFVDDAGVEQPMPEFDFAFGLHVRADGYDLRPIIAGPDQLREFLYVKQVGRFAEETSRTYVGQPLTPPRAMKRRRLEIVEDGA